MGRIELSGYTEPDASVIVERYQLVAESQLREEWPGAFDRCCVGEKD